MGNFWSIVDSFNPPEVVTLTLLVTMICIFYYQQTRNYTADTFAFNYDKIAYEGQWWRCAVAPFSHLSIFHIIMNMLSLWLLYLVERGQGHIYYLHHTILLLFGTNFCQYFAGWFLSKYKPSWVRFTNGAGYSGILFGWITYFSMLVPFGRVFGFIPSFLLPWIYLIVTQLLLYFVNVSFIGHLSGIIIGYMIAFNFFSWVDWYSSLTIALWVSLLLIYNAKTHQGWPMDWLVVSSSIGGGRRTMVVDGRISYADRIPIAQM